MTIYKPTTCPAKQFSTLFGIRIWRSNRPNTQTYANYMQLQPKAYFQKELRFMKLAVKPV